MQKDSMFTAAAGDRADVPDVAIVAWDGIATSDWQQAIDYGIEARQRGIRVIGFGVGSDVQPFGLSTITSWPSSETVFVANSSSHLPALRDPIVSATCNGKSYLSQVHRIYRIHRRQHAFTDDAVMSKHRLSPYHAYYHK